jgi:hypothetical protein
MNVGGPFSRYLVVEVRAATIPDARSPLRKWGFAAFIIEVTREGVMKASMPGEVEMCIVRSDLEMRKRSPVEREEEEKEEGGQDGRFVWPTP